MVKYSETHLDRIFSALGDKTRRQIVIALTHGEKSAQELAEPFAISLPAVSKHLKVLENSKIIVRKVQGRKHIFSLNPKSINSAMDWLGFHQDFWRKSMENLDKMLSIKTKRNASKA